MKKFLPISCFLAVSATASAQQAQLQRSVIASTGGTAQINNTVVQYTIGEVLIDPIDSPPLLVTQGFQQPEIAGNETEPEINFVNSFIVYPNPATGSTNVEFDLLKSGFITLQLVNNAGQTVRNFSVILLAGKIKYPMLISGLSSGLYYVVLKAANRQYSEKLVIQ
ncbi:T9SS type A sorting domain-containing protein [Pedobacter heparinus]|uniref:T9SS type A sorting domain-containing protein n=1 Tax=Pedobacter heparinus TaxID=984 RepID=UPI0029319FF7|nr:T9SS type A sorting domain-containing protein [Pedobacter heparinus]